VPELPDIVVYIEALEQRVVGRVLQQAEVRSAFLLRTAEPPLASILGRTVAELRRVGKRVAIGFDNDSWLVFHLMIAGRFHWAQKRITPDGRRTLAAFDFDSGRLTITEAGTKKRASLHLLAGEDALAKLDPGGADVYSITLEQFTAVLTSANHTLKRALTDPRLFSGIGNAYSDEIFFHARLSPIMLSQRLSGEEISRLFDAARSTLALWTDNLRTATGGRFPEKVTAFRPGMAVHGRYGEPCLICGAKIQRIRYASNETNYCASCQTGGKLLADRALSRLLREDWPRSLEELEERKQG
jgi:formamidopyrimidine-DNA glycosylase